MCDPSLGVQAVIELDDDSHEGKGTKDAARAALLSNAGYKVLRFANVLDASVLLAQLPLQTAKAEAKD